MKPLRTFEQADAYSSPWSLKTRLKGMLWRGVWTVLWRPTPKFLSPWRVFLLKLFGAKITGSPFVSQSAKVTMPWNLVMEDRACLGPGAEAYNLAPITLKARCTVAQYVYLCAGTHDLSTPRLPLMAGEIVVGEDVFVGAKALILPGVELGEGSVVGAGSVVTKDTPPWTICAGNPAKAVKPRPWEGKRASGE